MTALTATQEVKESFISQIEGTGVNNAIYVQKLANSDAYACFKPTSKQFQQEALNSCSDRKAILPTQACKQATYPVTAVWVDELICLP